MREITPLEASLAEFLREQELLASTVDETLAAKMLLAWLCEEYDRQLDAALGALK